MRVYGSGMSVPAAASNRPVLVDLGAARSRWERTDARGRRLDVAAGVLLVIVQTLTAWALWGLTGAVVSGTFFAVLVSTSRSFDQWQGRRLGGPATPGPSSWGQVVSHADGPEIWAGARRAARDAGFIGEVLLDAQTVHAVRRRTFGNDSWLTLRVEGVSGGRALVSVWVRPHTSGWMGARGSRQSRKLANAVLAAVPGATPVG